MTTFVLASASPARAATLRSAGIEPHIVVSGVDEDALMQRMDVVSPADVALNLARAKAEATANRPDLPANAIIVACDSVLDMEGKSLGKPGDAAEATRRWQRMRGRSGMLHTGHWVIDRRQSDAEAWPAAGTVASTTVEFANISDAEIDAYVATGEPLHVAGGFTIDGLGGAFVRGVQGDHHNVVGISLPLLRELLADFHIPWTSLWNQAQPAS